jgi:hypothetical protein
MTDFNIRSVLDWDYYKKRLGATIQKIVTIPAALQSISNPVPRVEHPDWLVKAISMGAQGKQATLSGWMEKLTTGNSKAGGSDKNDQKSKPVTGLAGWLDIENTGTSSSSSPVSKKPRVTTIKQGGTKMRRVENDTVEGPEAQQEGVDGAAEAPPAGAQAPSADLLPDSLAAAPPIFDVLADIRSRNLGTDGEAAPSHDANASSVEGDASMDAPAAGDQADAAEAGSAGDDPLTEWVASRKALWKVQRTASLARKRARAAAEAETRASAAALLKRNVGAKGKASHVLSLPGSSVLSAAGSALPPRQAYWQILEVRPTDMPGQFSVFAFVDTRRLLSLRIQVPRILYIHRATPFPASSAIMSIAELVNRRLPRDVPQRFLYRIKIREHKFQRHRAVISSAADDPQTLGVYETQHPLLLRCLMELGVVARLDEGKLLNRMEKANVSSAPSGAKGAMKSFLMAAAAGEGQSTGKKQGETFVAVEDPSVERSEPGSGSKAVKQSVSALLKKGRDGDGSGKARGNAGTLLALGFQSLNDGADGTHTTAGMTTTARLPDNASLAGVSASSLSFLGQQLFSIDDIMPLSLPLTTSPLGASSFASNAGSGPICYLEPSSATYRLGFLYHSAASDGSGRALTALYICKETNTSLASAYAKMLEDHWRAMNHGLTIDDTTANEISRSSSMLVPGLNVPLQAVCYLYTCSGAAAAGAPKEKEKTPNPVSASFALGAWHRVSALESADAKRIMELNGLDADPNTCEFHIADYAQQDDIWRRISLHLRDAAQASVGGIGARNPALVLLASVPLRKTALLAKVPALAEVPVVASPFSPSECHYATIGWARTAAGRSMAAAFGSMRWWVDRIRSSRFAQLPVGNMPTGLCADDDSSLVGMPGASMTAVASTYQSMVDPKLDTRLWTRLADVSFARLLVHNGHLLWTSRNALPDLGQGFGIGGQGVRASSEDADVAGLGGLGGGMSTGGGLTGGALLGAGDTSATDGPGANTGWDGTTGSFASSGMKGAVNGQTAAAEDVSTESSSGPAPAPLSLHVGSNPSVDNAGHYRTWTVEVSLQYLDVITVLNSSSLAVSGSGGVGGSEQFSDPLHAWEEMLATVNATAAGDAGQATEDGVDPGPGPLALGSTALVGNTGLSCVGAFRALKESVATWWAQVQLASAKGEDAANSMAYNILERLYRWVASPASLLHDPALQGLLHALMRRAFSILLRTMRHSGCQIVHASFQRVIVCLGKQSKEEAFSVLQKLSHKIAAHPALAGLAMTPTQWWSSLLYLDPHNYAGMVLNAEEANAVAASVAAGAPPLSASPEDRSAVAIISEMCDAATEAAVAVASIDQAPDTIDGDGYGQAMEQAVSNAVGLSDPVWRRLQREYVKDVTSEARLAFQQRWALADYLPVGARGIFTGAMRLYVTRPAKERAKRAFDRLRARAEAGVAPVLRDAVAKGGVDVRKWAAKLARSLSHAGEEDEDDDQDDVQIVEDDASEGEKRVPDTGKIRRRADRSGYSADDSILLFPRASAANANGYERRRLVLDEDDADDGSGNSAASAQQQSDEHSTVTFPFRVESDRHATGSNVEAGSSRDGGSSSIGASTPRSRRMSGSTTTGGELDSFAGDDLENSLNDSTGNAVGYDASPGLGSASKPRFGDQKSTVSAKESLARLLNTDPHLLKLRVLTPLGPEEDREEMQAESAAARQFLADNLRTRLLEAIDTLEPGAKNGGGALSLSVLATGTQALTDEAAQVDENEEELALEGELRAADGEQNGPKSIAARDLFNRRSLRKARYQAMVRSLRCAFESGAGFPTPNGRPALAAIISVCHVISADTLPGIAEELTKVRGTAFALLRVKDFSAEGRWIDPTATVTLPDVTCRVCAQVRDLDIARDEFLLADRPQSTSHGHSSHLDRPTCTWHCSSPLCRAAYDRGDLESQLVEYLQTRSTAYQVQDLVCVKCKRTRSSPLRLYCECSGKFVCSETRSNMIRTVSVLLGIAEAFQFPWLLETAKQLVL